MKFKQTKLKKATVILVLPDGTVIHGKGTFEAKKIMSQAVFTITLVKKIPKT